MRRLGGSHPRGFTLVELIVTIGIIALLIGILIPTVQGIRRSARVTRCASNLRQLGQAIHAYDADHHCEPQAIAMPAPFFLAGDRPHVILPIYEALDPYLPKTSPTYHCPDDAAQVFDRCAAASGLGLGISYVYLPTPTPPSISDLVMWDYLGDSTHGFITPPLHRQRGANTLYRDGSVKFQSGNQRE